MVRRPLRVLHLPFRTPYARKLRSPGFQPVNGSAVDGAGTVPDAVGARWVLDRLPASWFDVLHLHHLEFEEPADLERLLSACRDAGIPVVFTAHDTAPMFGPADRLMETWRLLAASGAGWVFLTEGSRRELLDRLGGNPPTGPQVVLPHGYVVPPEALAGKDREPGPAARFLLYGALRPNRDHLATVLNWSLGIRDAAARLHVVLRAVSPAELADPASRTLDLVRVLGTDPRIRTTLRPYPSDDEIVGHALAADALLLPYLWGTHSGQLELAFDLNLLPVASTVGHLREQRRQHGDRVPEPVWFDWSGDMRYLFGEAQLAAIEEAVQRLRDRGAQPLDREFLAYRVAEHAELLAGHQRLYDR